jgi:hypothetical protein
MLSFIFVIVCGLFEWKRISASSFVVCLSMYFPWGSKYQEGRVGVPFTGLPSHMWIGVQIEYQIVVRFVLLDLYFSVWCFVDFCLCVCSFSFVLSVHDRCHLWNMNPLHVRSIEFHSGVQYGFHCSSYCFEWGALLSIACFCHFVTRPFFHLRRLIIRLVFPNFSYILHKSNYIVHN